MLAASASRRPVCHHGKGRISTLCIGLCAALGQAVQAADAAPASAVAPLGSIPIVVFARVSIAVR